MRARAFVIVALVALPLACVDLFHSTDFETLHGDGGDGTPDVGAGDAVVDAGPKPLVDFCQWSSEEARAHAARACAWLGACGGPIGDAVLGPCMLHAMAAYDCAFNPGLRPNGAAYALWSCLSDVKSCGEVQACLGAGAATTCVAVASGSFTRCGAESANEIRLECGRPQAGPASAIEPCVLFGKACATIDDSTSICAGGARADCAAGLDCTGTAAVDCRVVNAKLVDQGVDCAAFGAGQCVLGDAGARTVACAPRVEAPACDGGVAVTCSEDGGTVATSCVGGKSIAFDCGRLGVPCDVSTKAIPTYDPLQACAERVDAGRCNAADDCRDGKLRSCAQGIAFEADCAALGLGACERVNNGALARCTPP